MDLHYWTRQGRLGSRGIDHILVPKNVDNDIWNFSGQMEKELGSLFFNSDHSLLTTTFTRLSQNEERYRFSSIALRYNEVFNIPLKTSGVHGQDSEFNDAKFKCKKLDEQKQLYAKIQNLTNPTSDFSADYKVNIDNKVSKLISNVWHRAISLGKDGKNNNLLKTNEEEGENLEEISALFKKAVANMMLSLDLDSEVNNVKTTNNNRNNIKKSGCTKAFNTLPISSKLRLAIKTVNRTIQNLKSTALNIQLEKNIRLNILNTNQRDLQKIKNVHPNNPTTPANNMDISKPQLQQNIKSRVNDEPNYTHAKNKGKNKANNDLSVNIERKIINIIKSEKIAEMIKTIAIDLEAEYEGWLKHTEAIKHVRKRNDLSTDKTYGNTIHTRGGDFLMNATPEDIDKLNEFMLDATCKKLFKNCVEDNDNPCDPQTITKYLQNWKDSLRKHTNWAGRINTADDSQLNSMPKAIDEALSNLRKLRRQLSWKQRVYKHDKLNYYCEINNMNALTNVLKPKVREAPSVHDLIYDKDEKKFRQCINVAEQLIATKNYHDKWMKPSLAKKSCFFAELIKEGSLGIRGVKTFPNKKFTKEDIKDVIHPYNSLNEEICERIIKAHGPHTADEFRHPKNYNKEFNYPFYFTSANGDLDNEFIDQDFWKAIYSIPTKARHNNFYIAVVGRMHKSWAITLLQIIKLIMVLRVIPKNINILSRIPIPKPEKPNEYRPLSVCDDLFCFVNGIFAKHASAAMERAKCLHDAVTAYRKGKGCSALVSIELSAREDCIESGKKCGLIMEDIEKIFDRLTAEVILNAMLKAGFPPLGYVEFKGSSMSFKKVLIQTIKGTILSTFECGLEQGNPDSPRAANLVIMNIHNMWKKATINNSDYNFVTVDKQDKEVAVGEAGYSDDNLVFAWDENTGELIAIIQKKIDMTGDFSIVCKLGRAAAKCKIFLFNIPAEEAKKIIKFLSIAWSFAKDKPVKEEIEIIMYLKKEDARKIDNSHDGPVQVTYGPNGEMLIQTSDNFSDLKHLGLTMDTQGNTYSSAKKIIQNIKAKISSLKKKSLKDNPQRHSCNMLLNSLHSFATLPNNINIQDLRQCDRLLIQNLRKRKGLCKHDTTIHIFIPEQKFGFGIKAFVDTYIIAIARELEVILNSQGKDAEGSRGRLAAHAQYFDTKLNKSPSFNHISDAILKLSHFGLFLRDSNDGILNYLIETLRKQDNKIPIGDTAFSKQKEPLLGEEHKELTKYIYGGEIHHFVNTFIQHKETNTLQTFTNTVKRKKFKHLLNLLESTWDKSMHQRVHDHFGLFNIQEWVASQDDQDPRKSTNWSYIDCTKRKLSPKNEAWTLENTWNTIQDLITIDPKNHLSWNKGALSNKDTSYGEVLQRIFNSKSPLIISTDGGLIID